MLISLDITQLKLNQAAIKKLIKLLRLTFQTLSFQESKRK